jgi:hypothetical protein
MPAGKAAASSAAVTRHANKRCEPSHNHPHSRRLPLSWRFVRTRPLPLSLQPPQLENVVSHQSSPPHSLTHSLTHTHSFTRVHKTHTCIAPLPSSVTHVLMLSVRFSVAFLQSVRTPTHVSPFTWLRDVVHDKTCLSQLSLTHTHTHILTRCHRLHLTYL